MFTHDTNNKITVGTFTANLADFMLLEPAYQLPTGAIWQFYVPGVKHFVGYGLYQRDEGPTWTDGDAYLAHETEYATLHPDTSPNVAGFEIALVAAFGGDYLAINSLYSGWPLFRDTLEGGQWATADLLLTNAYVNYEIDTATYTAIVAAARANYIPMALQGRPGLMPLTLIDMAYPPVAIIPGPSQSDALAVGATEVASYLVPLSSSDSATVDCTDAAALVAPLSVLADDTTELPMEEGAPVIV